MRTRAYVFAAGVALSAVVACSDDDGADEAASSTTESPEASVAGSFGDTSDDPFCASGDVLSGDIGTVEPDDDSPDALREQFAEAGQAIAEAEAEAPEEIKAAVATLARGYEDFFAALEAADFDFAQLSESALTALDSPELQAAGEQLDAYRADACDADG